ncbi:hypothetical protein CDAR_190101, partial [Caerostris darwini]
VSLLLIFNIRINEQQPLPKRNAILNSLQNFITPPVSGGSRCRQKKPVPVLNGAFVTENNSLFLTASTQPK